MMSNDATAWDHLDDELARWLGVRATHRLENDRAESPLDGTAMALQRVRATLGFLAASAMSDASMVALVSRAYRWSIRIARELEGIERQQLDAITEWSRLETFAPFALAFFDSVLAAPFAAALPGHGSAVARLRREVDAVLAPMSIALASSAMAA